MSGSTELNQSSIGSMFTLEAHLASTRSADLHRAYSKADGDRVGLWILRQPLAANSPAARRFINRLELLSQPGSSVTAVRSFGVDPAGVAYAVVRLPSGEPLTGAALDAKEAERRFGQCLRIIDVLHRAGLVCGDICDGSFWLTRDGNVELLGVLGSFDAEAASTAVLPPLDTLHFVAPEQRSGGGVEQASDVFSLGVLAYRLYTGAYPGEVSTVLMGGVLDLLSVKPLSAYNDTTPFWTEEIVFRCLEPQPVKRFSSAGELIEAIREVKEGGQLRQSLPAVTTGPPLKRDLVSPSVDPSVQQSFGKIPLEEEVAPPPPQFRKKKASHRSMRFLIAGVCLLTTIFVVIVGDMVLRSRAAKTKSISNELATHREAAGSEQLKQAIDVVSQKDSSLKEKEMYLDQISRSDDPLSHDILVKSARDAAKPEERALAEKAIFQRTRRLGYGKAAAQVEVWLARYLPTGALPSGYEAILKALNVSLPVGARNTVMQAAYAQAQEMALKLEAAIALDSPNPQQFQLALASSVGDALVRKDASNRSALALIYAHPLLAVTYEKDLESARDKINDEELLWVLEILVQRSDVLSKGLIQYLVDKRELSPVRKQYLLYLLARTDIPVDIAAALVRMAADKITLADVRVVGGWFDMMAPRVLLGVLVQTPETDVLREAFDLLAGRDVDTEPSDTLLKWVKANKWPQRTEYARAIGAFSLLDKLQPAEYQRAAKAIELVSSEPSLVQAIMDSNSPAAIKIVAERHADKMGLGLLLQLLRHDDKTVRIIGVKHLKGYNDLGALKYIIDNYEREKDPEVKKVYQDTFWVIRQRQGGR